MNTLDRAIEGVDIQAIYEPLFDSLQGTMESIGGRFRESIDRNRPEAEVTGNFEDYLTSINNFFDAQIEAVRAEERATGVLLTEVVGSIQGSRANVLNAARLASEASQPNLQAQSRGCLSSE